MITQTNPRHCAAIAPRPRIILQVYGGARSRPMIEQGIYTDSAAQTTINLYKKLTPKHPDTKVHNMTYA